MNSSEHFKPIAPGVTIGHVHLKVADLERSLAFYRGVLGFELTQRFGSQVAFVSAGGYHHHIGLNTWESAGGAPPPQRATGLYHLAILYLPMELIGWFVIVPFSLAALLSGLVQSLGTRWGLFRHWWILMKFLLTIVAVIVLFHHLETVSRMSRMAAEAALDGAGFRALQIQLLIHPAGGLVVLLAAMTLSVFKPWGMTAYAKRQRSQDGSSAFPNDHAPLVREPLLTNGRPRWARVAWIHAVHAIALVLLFVVIEHLTGGGIRHH